MSMLTAKDSFAMFLSQQLALEGIPMQWLLHDPSDPALSRLKINAVNLYFMAEYSEGPIDILQASIEIIHQTERTALIWQDLLTTLFRKSGIIKNKKYSVDPGNPTDEPGNVYWNVRDLRWTTVSETDYVHYNCTFNLHHYFAIT